MPGGPWTPAAPPTRPGLYINFISDALDAVTAGQRGRVAMIVQSEWGPANAAQEIDNFTDLINYFGTSETAPNNAYYAGRQAFLGGARQLRMYRIMGAGFDEATSTLQDTAGTPANVIRLDAKQAGVRGNAITYTTRLNPGDNTKTDLLLYLNGVLMATYTTSSNRGVAGHAQELVNLINSDTDNYLVTAVLLGAGNNTPALVTNTALAGGNNGAAPVSSDYIALLDTIGLESDEWDVFTVDIKNSDVSGIEATLLAWFKNLRNEGARVGMVLGSDDGESDSTAQASASTLNNEAIQYVYPGVRQVDSTGTLVTRRGAAFAAQVAGMRASLPLGQGMTFAELQEVISLEKKLRGSNIDLLINSGVTVLGKTGTSHHIIKGMTTLVSPGTAADGNPIPTSFKKVSVVNTTDAIAAAVELAARTNYIGKIPNDANGQAAIRGVVADFLRVMAGQRAIRPDYSVEVSETYESSGERLYLDMRMTVVDTVDEILVTARIGA